MTQEFTYSNAEFDRYAADYEAALAQGLFVSGEDKNYFAKRRVEWLAQCLVELDEVPRKIMDFGCGIGSATPFLRSLNGCESLLGVDTSGESLHVAQERYGSESTSFSFFRDFSPNGQVNLVFSNGVFHHISLSERNPALHYIYRSLRPSGLLAVWENNPWNPGTRYVMSRIPFDRDAIPVSPLQMRKLIIASGFEILRLDFLFIFPRVLRWFRNIEPLLASLPFGAQYQYLCRKLENSVAA